MPKILLQHNLPKADLTGRVESQRYLKASGGVRSKLDVAMIRRLQATRARQLSHCYRKKLPAASNLPVCKSYLQRQPCTTLVCMGLRLLMSASPDRVIRI